jgi:hypothetical protein
MRNWITVVGLLMLSAKSSAAPGYLIQTGSTLQFQGTQQGEKFSGNIKAFDARIVYDSADYAGSVFDVTMSLKSMDSHNLERDQAMQTADWFDLAHHPVASFKTVGFRTTAQGVVADADLSIKGRIKRIVFPFQWRKTAANATLDARVSVDRLDFGLGAGEWADESLVGRRVDVIVHLNLMPAPPSPTAPPRVKSRPSAPLK